jgi:ATP-dependent Clp protease, protease subunit
VRIAACRSVSDWDTVRVYPGPRQRETVGKQMGMPLDDSTNNRLLNERIVLLGSEVTDEVANRICAQLLQLAAEDPERDIWLYINSPGGSVYSGMAIYDTMQFVTNDVATVAMGLAGGMGQLLLCAGARGKRYSLSHARILMRQPSGGIGGTAAEIAIQAEQMLCTKRLFLERTAFHTGKSPEQIEADTDRDRWFTAEQARDYGLIDHVISRVPAEGGRVSTRVATWATNHARTVGRTGYGTRHTSPGGRLWPVPTSVVALAAHGLHTPLALLADLVAMTGGGPATNGVLAPLANRAGIRALRDLAWPPAARCGFAALLVADLAEDARYVAPPVAQHELASALATALASPPTDPVPVAAQVSELIAAADRITPQILTLLSIVGPDAVAADPVLPLRLRDQAVALLPLDERPRQLLADTVGALARYANAAGQSSRVAAGTVGIRRRGSLPNLVPTQLALPRALFTHRYAAGDLLYRTYEADAGPSFEPVTIVLDTSPTTFGPVESVLRWVAHAITATLWAARQNTALILLDDPDRSVTLSSPADLVRLWSSRSLDPPLLGPALDTATRSHTRTVVLTGHHLAREHPVVPGASLRVLTTHAPGDPPARATGSPFHQHVPPRPTAYDVARAVLNLLVSSPPWRGEIGFSRSVDRRPRARSALGSRIHKSLPEQSPPEEKTVPITGSGTLRLPRHVLDSIVAHARRDHPDMACGIVAGRSGSNLAERFVPMENAEHSTTFFRFDGAEQVRVWQEMMQRGEEPVVIYYSHTATPAYPSRTSINLAQPEPYYLIVSTAAPETTEIRSFRIVDRQVFETPFAIID